jgi:hypothetical protein
MFLDSAVPLSQPLPPLLHMANEVVENAKAQNIPNTFDAGEGLMRDRCDLQPTREDDDALTLLHGPECTNRGVSDT